MPKVKPLFDFFEIFFHLTNIFACDKVKYARVLQNFLPKSVVFRLQKGTYIVKGGRYYDR